MFPLKGKKCVNNIRLIRCVQTQVVQSRIETSIKQGPHISHFLNLKPKFFFFKVAVRELEIMVMEQLKEPEKYRISSTQVDNEETSCHCRLYI